MKRYFRSFLGALALCVFLFLLCVAPPPAFAAGNSGVWTVTLMPDNTYMSGTTTASIYGQSGVSLFVIDLTAKNHYTGNLMGFVSGLTLSPGVGPLAYLGTGTVRGGTGVNNGVTNWPPDKSTGVSIYYAEFPSNPLAGATPNPIPSSISSFWLAQWTLINEISTTLLSGATYFSFDIPANPAAPYVGLKLVPSQATGADSGASQFSLGLHVSSTGDPK